MDSAFIEYISGFISEKRLNLFGKLLTERTRYITVVLEDIYQSQNASAVLRSCDCFGIQDVHVIENRNQYNINPDVALGSQKWLNIFKYNKNKENTLAAFDELKSMGYRIVATTPHKKSVSIETFDLKKGKVALAFGTELEGLSKTAIENSDEYLYIPMYGFSESLNISVSAAILLQKLSTDLRVKDINWQLNENEKKLILKQWLMQTVKHAEQIEQEYYKRNQS